MDHCRKERRRTNPREITNIFSLLTFAYVGGVFKKAFRSDFNENDLYEVLRRHRSKNCGDKLENEWKHERKQKNPSVGRLIWKCYGKKYVFIGLIDFVYNTLNSVFQPYVVSQFVTYFTPGQTTMTRNDAYFFAFTILIIYFFNLFYTNNYEVWVKMFGIEIRTAFSSLLYRKALKLSPTAMADTNLGNIITLITRDVQCFVSVIFSINNMWVSTTQVIVICYLLYNKLGDVAFVGIGILFVTFPLQVYLASWVTKLRLEACTKTDERLQQCQEILSKIRVIKMYTWEAVFDKKVNTTRKEEMKRLMLCSYLREVLLITGGLYTNLAFYMLILACTWSGTLMDTSTIFYILSNFRDLRHFLVYIVPVGIGTASEFLSSYRRLKKALVAEELIEQNAMTQTEKPLVQLKEATLMIEGRDIFKKISSKITKGLTVITGAVGSGKSSLLKTVLGDLSLDSGLVVTQGKMSYASQDSWLFPSSIRQNILFGETYNEKRYQKVIEVCALSFDLNMFASGDETILTDLGSNLSKGQQARINLARAVYRNSDIYLLDDSLTALDTSVQDYIFNECIKKFLKDKICILVSQSDSHIQQADNVIIMDEGKMEDLRNPSKIVLKNNEILWKLHDNEKEMFEDDTKRSIEAIDEKSRLIDNEQNDKVNIYGEIKKRGSVNWRVYTKYFLYGGGIIILFFNIAMRGGTQLMSSYSDKLFTNWVDTKQIVLNMESGMNSNFNSSSLEAAKMLERNTFRLYSIFVAVSTALDLITTYILWIFFKKASLNLHKIMVQRIINSVMSFFNTHLIGNILNRFSQDMINVDEHLSNTLDQCIRTTFTVSGIIFILIFINSSFAIIISVVLVSAMILARIYLPASRSLKRLEASTRSPMIGHLNATLEGLTTVRASQAQNILIEEYDKHQDVYTSANFLYICSQKAFGFFMDILCSVFVIFVVVKFLFFNSSNTAGDVGLCLAQVSFLSILLNFGFQQFTDLENCMTSLERVLEYTDIKIEKKDGKIMDNWPTNGSIRYQKVSLSYSNNDNLVLNNLNFEIKGKEKIGIVGRTGAGKSSIISTLFRLYDTRGTILIDGVDVELLSLGFLRRNIVVIPQDPIIFSGTIRTNLDPLSEFTNKDLWKALEKVEMQNSIANLEQKINSNVSNFSSGQKQLLCLARAILRKNKIVVMDEATANLDDKTDRMLHKILKESFSDCTVLVIAHRLHSVLDCDKVMVIDKGEIQEFDNPVVLLNKKKGIFYSMVRRDGLL